MPPNLKPGDPIDRYVVESVLGVGSMATVYGVRHSALDKRYAVKLLHTDDKGLQERLMREGRLQASLEHPNIARVDDVFIHQGAPALLMERVDGPDLYQWLHSYKPTLDEALAVFGGILSGVQVAHNAAVTHRDLKPGNILMHLAPDGTLVPKVLDFGLAKALDPKGTNKTTAGEPLGTPWYMAPEQIKDASKADQRADIFSLSCILYEMVTGTVCFGEDDVLETYRRIATGAYPPPRDFVSDLPYNVTTAIEYGLIADPAKRTQDCGALGRALWKNDPWPTAVPAGPGVDHAKQLHQQYEAHRASSAPASVGPGLSSVGSGQLLDDMAAAAQSASAAEAPKSWGPTIALALAAMMLLTTMAVAAGAVAIVLLN